MLYINTEDQITDKTKILRLIPLEPAMTIPASVDSNLNKAITITNKNKSRPIKYLRSKLYYYKNNNRENRKIGESISNLIDDLCNKEKKTYNRF